MKDLVTNIADAAAKLQVGIISTATLGMAFEPEERYENPDGSEIVFAQDYFGEKRGVSAMPGPFAAKDEWEHALAVRKVGGSDGSDRIS